MSDRFAEEMEKFGKESEEYQEGNVKALTTFLGIMYGQRGELTREELYELTTGTEDYKRGVSDALKTIGVTLDKITAKEEQ